MVVALDVTVVKSVTAMRSTVSKKEMLHNTSLGLFCISSMSKMFCGFNVVQMNVCNRLILLQRNVIL